MTKSKLKTDIFNYTTPEFFINMKNIPLKGSDNRGAFIIEEKRKCREGININGVFIPGSLYFHLNYYKLEGDHKTIKGKKDIFLPTLRDNEWIVFNDYENAVKESKAYTLFGLRQCGKELADYEEIITKEGLKPTSNIKVGDVVYGKDGKETNVVGVFPQGIKPIYRMTLLDGRTIDCGLDHQWEVYTKSGNLKVLTTKEIKNKMSSYNYFHIPLTQPVEYSEKNLPIDPYILGYHMGDGDTKTGRVCSLSQDIVNRYKLHYEVYKSSYDDIHYNAKKLVTDLRKYNLYDNKHIPDIYFLGSIEQRWNLLHGLCDSDAGIVIQHEGKTSRVIFTNKNKLLADAVLKLCYSLGLSASCKKLKNYSYYKDTKERFQVGYVYRVEIFNNPSVFYTHDKKAKVDYVNKIRETIRTKHTDRLKIKSIEYLCEHSATCIAVDNKDHIYLTKDFIPTHNTEMETSLCLRELSLFKSTEALALFAGDNFKKNFTKKLRIAIEHGEHFMIIPNIDKDWTKDEIRFGLTKEDNTLDLRSTLYIYNTQEGKKMQVASGKSPSFFLIDEAGVSPFRKVYETVKPSLLADDGFLRCSPFLTLTGGDAEFSKDAENFIRFPIPEEQVLFDYNGKTVGGRFLDGRYRKDCKIESTISDYTGKKTNTWLDDFPIKVTDFENALLKIEKEKSQASKSPDKNALLMKRIFFPLTIEDVFLSENENPFPREALEQQKQFLLSNPIGQNIELFRGLNGNTQFKFSNKLPISSYPVQTGDNLDAPIVMYDSPDKFKGQKGIHVLGGDFYNDDETVVSDSLGSTYIMRKFHSDLSDPFNGCMVASYTARPKTMKEFNKTALMEAEFWDALIMYEHTGGSIKDFFESENKLHLLIDTPSLTKEISPNSKAGNTKGLRATPAIQKHALNLVLDYLNEELPNGQLGVTRILDTLLIDEMLAYDGVKNTDRYIAFSMAIEALYMYKKYTTIVNYQEENVKPEPKVKFDAFGNVRKSGSLSNAFGF